MIDRIRISNLGPIEQADVRLADLTMIVGPQATGKSVFLQTLKLLVDGKSIQEKMRYHGLVVTPENFLDLYFGAGMASVWTRDSKVLPGRARKPTDLAACVQPGRSDEPQRVFYVPAERALALNGQV